MLDSLDDLILLEEAPERVVELAAGLVVPVTRDLQRHQRAGLFAFGQIQVRDRARGQAPYVAIPADESSPEALLLAPIPMRTPHRTRIGLTLLRGGDRLDELIASDLLEPEHRMHAKGPGGTRIPVVSLLTDKDHGSESAPPPQIPSPLDAFTAAPAGGQQHGIESLRQKFRREGAFNGGSADNDLRAGPDRAHTPPDTLTARVVFFDEEQAHGHARITTRAGYSAQ